MPSSCSVKSIIQSIRIQIGYSTRLCPSHFGSCSERAVRFGNRNNSPDTRWSVIFWCWWCWPVIRYVPLWDSTPQRENLSSRRKCQLSNWPVLVKICTKTDTHAWLHLPFTGGWNRPIVVCRQLISFLKHDGGSLISRKAYLLSALINKVVVSNCHPW